MISFVSMNGVPARRALARSLRRAECCLLVAGSLSLLGCSGGDSGLPELGDVTGVVTLDGQPLSMAKVEFAPLPGRPSFAETKEDGSYRLQYTDDHSGAIVGPQTVKIYTGGYSEAGPIPEKLPARYHERTELKADVKPGNNEFNFDLTSK